jgi:D-arabinose 1-dehydrogenase-like Zn-dependent alcohol dehydrogenase
MVIGATFDPIEVAPEQLVSGSRTIQGWAAGTPADSEDTLRFAELTGVRPMIETYGRGKVDPTLMPMIRISRATRFRFTRYPWAFNHAVIFRLP